MPEPTESRLARLEEWRDSVASTLTEIRANMRTLSESAANLAVVVERLSGQLASKRECPQPGKCVELLETVQRFETRLGKIERERDVEKAAVSAGGWFVRALIVAVLAAACAAIGHWLIP